LSQTDEQLVERARGGDRQAFHQLVDLHAPRLYQLANIMTGNFNDAQDLVQETLIGAYEALGAFQGRSTVKTWLTGIMIRQASLQRRKNARSKAMDSLDRPTAHEPADSGQQVNQTDSRLDLMTLMARLTHEHREVLMLREIEGLSYDQIAQLTGQARGTVESRLFRARHALRQLVEPDEPRSPKRESDGGVQ
jgi:RNA polymerase sigma-70 factor (ECF subfamily)